MKRKDKGELSEACVIAKLKEKGYAVLTPFGDNQPYDLVYEKNHDLEKVQVKTGKINEGCIEAKLDRGRVNGQGFRREEYEEGDFDEYMIYCSENSEVYKVSFDEATKTQITFRLEPTKNNQSKGVRWAEDYKL